VDLFGADGYALARELLQRGVAALYVVAFAAVVHQWRPLLGARGLTPTPTFLARVPFRRAPSLFHWRYSDQLAVGLGWVGIVLAVLALLGLPQRAGGVATPVVFLVLWALYLSYVNVGQRWYAFGWESLLLEAGFLVAFLGGHDTVVPWPTLLLLRWLVFRVEFGAGLIKLRGDPCWRDLTCLAYHHETQPLPSRFSWWFHHLPAPLHRAEVAANHVTQLVVPFLLFLPQPFAGGAAVAVIVTQGWLVLSGNFAWLNAVTIVLATSALPDAWLAPAFGWLVTGEAADPAEPAVWFVLLVGVVAVVQLVLSWRPVSNLVSPAQRMNASFNPLHLVGTYGAFGSVTRQRYELVIEGTADPTPTTGSTWLAYELPAKPGDPMRRPRQIAPYHLRLDWLLWFAAMTAVPTRQHAWLPRLLAALLDGDPHVRRLFASDPFDGTAPTAVRVRRYRYRYSTRPERRTTGAWWVRDRVGDHVGIVTRADLP
jgi:hypothetical protein